MRAFIPNGYLTLRGAIECVHATTANEQSKPPEDEAAKMLRHLLFEGQVLSQIITNQGSLIDVPKELWGGRFWDWANKGAPVTIPYGVEGISGYPLIWQDSLKSAFNLDGSLRQKRNLAGIAPNREGRTHEPRRGRKAKWDWDGAIANLLAIANSPDGLPESQAEIERLVADWFMRSAGDQPAESAIRQHVVTWCREILGKA